MDGPDQQPQQPPQQRPLPYGLVVAIVMIGVGTWTAGDGWVKYGGIAAIAVLVGALLYQVIGPQDDQ